MFFTIGHSNHPWHDFVDLLRLHKIDVVADVRHYPGSRACPQYNKETMQTDLAKEGIAYLHILKLGGRRTPDTSERNAGWEHKSFKGYADYTSTEEFRQGIQELLDLNGRIAILCAEAVPWRCHRRIISDYLTAQGIPVYEIISKAEPKLHTMTSFAVVMNGELSYPSAQKKLQ